MKKCVRSTLLWGGGGGGGGGGSGVPGKARAWISKARAWISKATVTRHMQIQRFLFAEKAPCARHNIIRCSAGAASY